MPQSELDNPPGIRPTIALTMGDPAGIGPEVVLQAAADPELAPLARWIVVGDAAVLEMAERVTGIALRAELHDARALRDRGGVRASADWTRAAAPPRWNTCASRLKCACAERPTRW